MPDATGRAEQLWHEPDWNCPICLSVNRAIRTRCRICGANNPLNPPTKPESSGKSGPRPGTCAICEGPMVGHKTVEIDGEHLHFNHMRCIGHLQKENQALYIALKSLWSAVAKYGQIGHEGSELLEVMSEAREVLAKARGEKPDAR